MRERGTCGAVGLGAEGGGRGERGQLSLSVVEAAVGVARVPTGNGRVTVWVWYA